jgi:hypothetical protein
MELLFPVGSDGVDIFFVISSFIIADTMSRPDQRSVRASWILRRTGEATDTIKPVGLPHDLQENPPSTKEILHNGVASSHARLANTNPQIDRPM